MDTDNRRKSDELIVAYKELAFQNEEKKLRAAELVIANIELDFQNTEKEKRAAELVVANIERNFQNIEKEKRAAELVIANIERDFQNEEKEKRAAELMIANIELAFQNKEKEKRAAELMIANQELIVQNREKEERAAELVIANIELAYQNKEKEKRAAELMIANKELIIQNNEKEKRAAELVVANIELAYQNKEKEKRAAELMNANKELIIQSEEKEKQSAELVIANKELDSQMHAKELNKKKDEFIGLASHELKTPLTSINAYLQFLQRNLANDEKNKQLIDKALQQVGKLSSLISDLLDVSKIGSGKLPLLFRTFDMAELLQEVVEMVQYGILTHKIKINFKLEKLPVFADRQRIEQVMINLISNAVKYSPNADRIIISLSETDAEAVLSIEDFGIGIKNDDQAHIFSRFYRVEELAPYISGLGIGLYISQDIISRHHGTLSVESKFGIGSTFSFRIPKDQRSE
jgi:signal transduction histidine kinase